MDDETLLERIKSLGDTRAAVADALMSSDLAPRKEKPLTPSALGMWFVRGRVPHSWRPAALDCLGLLRLDGAA